MGWSDERDRWALVVSNYRDYTVCPIQAWPSIHTVHTYVPLGDTRLRP